MISIPKQVAHRHSNSESNTDIKEDLTAQFSYNGRQVADLIGARGARWGGVFGPVDDWVLNTLETECKGGNEEEDEETGLGDGCPGMERRIEGGGWDSRQLREK